MNSWCKSCARKNQCYTVDIRPKCFVSDSGITSNDCTIEWPTEPQTMYYSQVDGITPSVIVQCYLRKSCDHYGDKQVCGRCREYNLYSHAKTEPQTEYPCNTCANKGDHDGECSNCITSSERIRWKTPSHYKPKQGEWIDRTKLKGFPEYECSACHAYGQQWMTFCPNCGAKMKEQ